MVERRTQGRPARGANEVGREKIVENLRAMMREADFDIFSRKKLAAYSGVTPALITYYFPKRVSLIEAATTPVMQGYYQDLHAILHSNQWPTERLRQAIRLLITCHASDGKIFAAYNDLMQVESSGAGVNYVALMAKELTIFFHMLIETGPESPQDSELLRGAVWGMCESLAQRSPQTKRAGLENADGGLSEAAMADRLFDFITRGLSHWVPWIGLKLPDYANDADPR